MITDRVDSKYNLAELFHQKAACRDLLAASHLTALDHGLSSGTGNSGQPLTDRARVRVGKAKRLIQLPEPVDAVKQIHDARARCGNITHCSPANDDAGQPSTSVHLSSTEIFVEGIAHHFNNVFMAIQGYVSLLQREINPDHPGSIHLRRIEKLVHCESILTNDLLCLLIGRPNRISDRDQNRLLRQIGKIACAFGATTGIRPMNQGAFISSNPPEQILRSLSGSIACILGRLLSDIHEQAALFASDIEADAPALQRLQKISELTQQGLHPVCQLLGYAGYTALPNGHRIARSGLIDAVRKTFAFKKERIRLFMDVDVDLPKIKLQHRQLVEILMAVLDNAAEAMSPGGDLFFEAVNMRPEEISEPGWNVPAKNFIRLTVRDSGHGFDPRFGRLIFEPFFTNKGREGHRGLGLSSIYGMVNTLGGYIAVKTEPGRGTIFHIYLPSEKASLSRKSNPDARKSRSCGKQVIPLRKCRRRNAGCDRMSENT